MKKDPTSELLAEMSRYRALVSWYAKIVTYLLNRAENLPVEIKDLIREASAERMLKYGGLTLEEHAMIEDEERNEKPTNNCLTTTIIHI